MKSLDGVQPMINYFSPSKVRHIIWMVIFETRINIVKMQKNMRLSRLRPVLKIIKESL
jgi:hypothetical protein